MANKYALFLAAAFSASLALSSCSKKGVKKDEIPSLAEETVILPTIEVEGSSETITMEEPGIRDSRFEEQEFLPAIHFEFDKYNLGEKARKILAGNATLMKRKTGRTFLVEGHCDDRGTIEYNLALGQKRAKEVRDYYIRLGVPADQIGTISYGEENPVCEETTEECWARNRRAETKIKIQR